KELPERGVRYCRRVTLLWGIILTVHGIVSIACWPISPDLWKLYNTRLFYVIFLSVFLVEYVVRQFVKNSEKKRKQLASCLLASLLAFPPPVFSSGHAHGPQEKLHARVGEEELFKPVSDAS